MQASFLPVRTVPEAASPPPSLESGIDSIASPPEGEKASDAACAVG